MRKREDYKTNLSFLREKRGLTQSNLSALAVLIFGRCKDMSKA